MNLTVLMENTTDNPALAVEHGLSIHIAGLNGKNYLMDTGAGPGFAENAAALGVDLKALDAVIISHNHNDHIGGLPWLLENHPALPVYIKSEARGEFLVVADGEERCISSGDELFGPYGGRFRWVEDELALDDGVYLLASTRRDPEFASRDAVLCKRENGAVVPDDFRHELYMAIMQPDGLVLLTGCSHIGIVNIVRSARERFPGVPVKAVVGGLHMKGRAGIDSMGCPPEFVKAVADELALLGVGNVHTCHCTGNPAYAILSRELGEHIGCLRTGYSFEIA